MILDLVVFFWMNKNISLRKHSVQATRSIVVATTEQLDMIQTNSKQNTTLVKLKKHFLAFPNEILALTRTSILSLKHPAEKL